MPAKLQPVRGTHDILPEESLKRKALRYHMEYVCSFYNYREVATPIFEFSEVFHRSLGETSDVVNKETYTFEDRGGESLTLRPEFTAPVVRAFINGGFTDKLPFKAYYQGPAFRYERPQKGRMRQFHQFGAEYLGHGGPLADSEMIAMASHLLDQLALGELVTLELNSLGDSESRLAYREALVAYFSQYKSDLSEDSVMRLEKNPLRILDSKNEGDKKIVADAPDAKAYFTADAEQYYDTLRGYLDTLGVKYHINPHLVRGLDYYSHSVFEFTTDKLGAQGTVLAGGHYDGLCQMMGGPDIAGVGFAAGIERLLALMEHSAFTWWQEIPGFAVIPLEESYQAAALTLAQRLRHARFVAEIIAGGNMSKRLKKAHKMNAIGALLLGEDEMKQGNVTVKFFENGEQHVFSQADVAEEIKQHLQQMSTQ